MMHQIELLYNISYKQKIHPTGWISVWRRGRDSNPRELSPKLISSQPRYDHFDTSAYMIKLGKSLIFVVYPAGSPRYAPLRFPKFQARLSLREISTAAAPYCSLDLPPAALANVPTSIRLHIYLLSFDLPNK